MTLRSRFTDEHPQC